MPAKTDMILATVSGILLIAGFPPFDLYPLAWAALVPLLMALQEKNAKTSFLIGTATGFVFFLGTIYWVFNSIYYYGNISAIPGAFLLIMLCIYLSLYFGLFSIIFTSLSRRSRLPAIILTPLIWVTVEYIRTYAFTGFPWSILGYTQYRFLSLIQISDITGVYGISFLVAASNGLICDLLQWRGRSDRMPLSARGPVVASAAAYMLILILTFFYGHWRLGTDADGQTIRASVIQGNIEQGLKWDKGHKENILDTYKRLSVRASADKPDIIIWPESSIPFIYGYEEKPTMEFNQFQRDLGANLLFGSVIVRDIKAGNPLLSNSAVLLSPEGNVISIYDKMHLVPYGEYVPLKKFFPFINRLTAGIGDFVRGKEPVVMETSFARIGNLICYEIIFPGLVRKSVHKGANLLVTITNDAWFGRTSAPYQHFSMAVLRAVENRVPVVRAANTGISGFIDSRGKIVSRSKIFVEDVLTEDIVINTFKKSFYAQFGDLFAFLCILCTVLLIFNNIFPEKKAL